MKKIKQFLIEVSDIQINGQNSLCPYLSLAIASNFISYEHLKRFPASQNRLSTKKILKHALGNSRHSTLIYRCIERGYSFKEISTLF